MQLQTVLKNEHGGINDAMANLYGITQNPDHLRIAQALNHQLIFEPLLHGDDQLDGLHANTQIPKIIGAARQYELTGNEDYKTIATNFWKFVAHDRSFIFGGNSDTEHFFPRGTESKHLTQTTGETCNTYNMLKLTRHIFAWQPTSESIDFYERGLYNHILASQAPDTGAMIYFMSLQPGFHKLYATPEDTFWCCTGTGMENHAKYADTIYFHDADSLYVNLFIPSELHWTEKGLTLRQETHFPEADDSKLTLHVSGPVQLTIRIRVPQWTKNPTFAINGAQVKESDLEQHDGYVAPKRQWNNRDDITIHLPMSLEMELLPDAPKTVALTYGPLVLAGDLGTEGIHQPYQVAGAFPVVRIAEAIPLLPGIVTTPAELLSHISQDRNQPMTFVTHGIGHPTEITLVPLYRLAYQRYNVYWQLLDDDGWRAYLTANRFKEEARKAFAARVLDEVWAHDANSEESHDLNAENSRAISANNFLARTATNGGFSWTLKADGAARVLRVGYVTVASPKFDILIDGKQIAEDQIKRSMSNGKLTTLVKSYDIPADVAQAKQALEIRFAGRETSGTARIIFCQLLRAAPEDQ